MPKSTKVTSFFHERRRELMLSDYHVLQTKAEEKRIKLFLEMPISNHSLVSIPAWISEPFQIMEKADSCTARSNIEVMLEGMTIDVYPTDQAKAKTLTATSAMLKGFHLITDGEGEDKDTTLHFSMYVPGSIQLRDWCWEYLGKTFFAAFTYSQTELNFSGDEDEDEDEDDQVPAARVSENQMSLKGPEHDAEFASAKDKKAHAFVFDKEKANGLASKVAPPRRPRGFGKSTSAGLN